VCTWRGGLVFKAHRLCVSINSRLESNKEEKKKCAWSVLAREAASAGDLAPRGIEWIKQVWRGYMVCTWYSSQFKNNCFTEMRSGSEEGSCLRLVDGCITQL